MSGVTFVQAGTAVIALLGAVITYVLIPYLKTRTTTAKQERVSFWVSIAVNAAEQIFGGSGTGAAKKQHVIEFLKNKGINLSTEQLDALIEAAVFEMNQLKLMKR